MTRAERRKPSTPAVEGVKFFFDYKLHAMGGVTYEVTISRVGPSVKVWLDVLEVDGKPNEQEGVPLEFSVE